MLFFVSKGYRVVAHDRRGHGRSAQVSWGHDMDHYAADASPSPNISTSGTPSISATRPAAVKSLAMSPNTASRRAASLRLCSSAQSPR
jgi:alpha-beta hydrolase superfamily lysophospholipase